MNALSLKPTFASARQASGRRRLHVCAAQELQGRVVSTSGDKTTIVAVENITVHPLYSKRVKRTVRHTCQDNKGEAAVGDLVTLVPTRPLSKTKRFIVDEVLQKAT